MKRLIPSPCACLPTTGVWRASRVLRGLAVPGGSCASERAAVASVAVLATLLEQRCCDDPAVASSPHSKLQPISVRMIDCMISLARFFTTWKPFSYKPPPPCGLLKSDSQLTALLASWRQVVRYFYPMTRLPATYAVWSSSLPTDS